MKRIVRFGSILVTSARSAFGRPAECTSMRLSRSSEGKLPTRGRGEQYLGMMYSSSPATQSPRRPPARQSMRGWKLSCAQDGSSLLKRPAHCRLVHGGGGGEPVTVGLLASMRPVAAGVAAAELSAVELTAGGGGGGDDCCTTAPAAGSPAGVARLARSDGEVERLPRVGVAKSRSSDGLTLPPVKFSCAR